MPTQLLTTKQVAERLGLHIRTVKTLLARGDLPSLKIGKSRRVRQDYLETWLLFREAETERQAAAKPKPAED